MAGTEIEQPKSNQELDKVIEIYDQIENADEVVYMTAALLTFSNHYGYSLHIANAINGRQGKNRITVSESSYTLMSYSMDQDIDELLDKRLTQQFIDVLNSYLADKQVLPSNPSQASGMMSRVKALLIMLITTNQYGLIPKLNIPPYCMKMAANLFDELQKLKDESLKDFVKYLKEQGNDEMAEIITSVGNDFWGSEGVKPNVTYDKYFGKMQDRIKEPILTYQKYLEYRRRYIRSTKSLLPSTVYDIFDITSDQYNRARLNVYTEIRELYGDPKKLIFE